MVKFSQLGPTPRSDLEIINEKLDNLGSVVDILALAVKELSEKIDLLQDVIQQKE